MNLPIDDKPMLLKAIEMILTSTETIQKKTDSLYVNYERKNQNLDKNRILSNVANKIITHYSNKAALIGGATSMSGVIPGIGTVMSMFGGATVDTALSMKYQIEMSMALAHLYGHDISVEEQKRICMIVAGLGTLTELSKKGAREIGEKAFSTMVEKTLKDNTKQALIQIFKRLGVELSQKSMQKAIPFGVGMLVSFGVNKAVTKYVGFKAKTHYHQSKGLKND